MLLPIMSSLYQLFVFCMLFGLILSEQMKRAPICPEAYSEISPEHTMCLPNVGTPVKLTAKQKRAALKEHNNIRARVSPRPANMLKLEWDEDLAKVATKWAAQCKVAHDTIRALPKLKGVWVGQNLAAGNFDLLRAIRNWESEIQDFRYGKAPTGVVGHYTQIVNAGTSLVGCGVADCPSSLYRRFQVCNYAVGQSSAAHRTPFKQGAKGCDDCPQNCDSSGRLCACGGKICLNQGRLDLTTCTCACSKLYTGSRCQKVKCYADHKNCAYYKQRHGKDVCNEFSNMPELCPHMCKKC